MLRFVNKSVIYYYGPKGKAGEMGKSRKKTHLRHPHESAPIPAKLFGGKENPAEKEREPTKNDKYTPSWRIIGGNKCTSFLLGPSLRLWVKPETLGASTTYTANMCHVYRRRQHGSCPINGKTVPNERKNHRSS